MQTHAEQANTSYLTQILPTQVSVPPYVVKQGQQILPAVKPIVIMTIQVHTECWKQKIGKLNTRVQAFLFCSDPWENNNNNNKRNQPQNQPTKKKKKLKEQNT